MIPATERSATPAGQQRSLLFAIGDSFFRVELTRLRAVLPWAELEPAEERGLCGWLRYRGGRVPVVDLGDLVMGEPTPRLLGSRILLLECRSRGNSVLVGAIAAQVFAMALEQNSRFAEHFDPCDVLSSVLLGLGAR